ncbi:MAG: site-specific DNA-methyltransferase [Planctomycetes bacterium]|nr:site-specific DNA-methyltransferase [Planctomycetota bacterium]
MAKKTPSSESRPEATPQDAAAIDPPRDELIVGDCLDVLPGWKAGSVNLVFADPPYNIGYKYHGYNDRLPYDRYVKWSRDWIAACTRVLADDGSIYIAIGDEYAAEVRMILKDLGLHLRNWIVWHYTFGQNCTRRFNRSHAHVFYACKDEARAIFNADDPHLRIKSKRLTTYNDKRANPKGKLPDDTWTFSRVCGTFKERCGWHPCQMPEALLERVIRASSRPGDLVLDPFAGSGTTCVVAKRLGRHYVGMDISEQYVVKSRQRLADDESLLAAESPSQ